MNYGDKAEMLYEHIFMNHYRWNFDFMFYSIA